MTDSSSASLWREDAVDLVHQGAIDYANQFEIHATFNEIHKGLGTHRERMRRLVSYVAAVDRSRERDGLPPIVWPHWFKQVRVR